MSNTKLTITSKDMITLSDIFDEELKKAGVEADQVPLIGTRGTILQASQHLFETVNTIIENNNINSSIMTTFSKAQLISALTQRLYKASFSKPSTITLYVEIPISDIIKFGTTITPNTYEFVFTDANTVILDEISFMPEKSKYYIRVTKKQTKYSVRAFYYNELGVAVNIPIQKLKMDRYSESVIMTIDFIQVVKEITTKTFQDSELDYFIITTSDLLYDFSLEHATSLAGPYTKLEAVTVLNRGNDKALKYEYRNEYSIGLEYKYIQNGFKASKGDTLRITTYSTVGRNINFSGTPNANNKNPKDLRVNYISSENDGTYKSYGGLNNSSQIDLLRNTIITANGTRFKIDTEQDMATYLNQYQGISKFKAKLSIQDIEHVFSIFTLLRFEQTISTGETQNFVIPTNTGTVQVDLTTLPKKVIDGYNYYAVRSDMPIKSIQSNIKESFDLIQEYDGSGQPELDKSLFYYVSPFLYSIREIDGMVRCYADSQYANKYQTTAIYESDDENITTRFINTTLRVNDYIDEESNQRIFNISAQIRCDESDIELTDDTFQAKLKVTDVDGQTFDIIGEISKVDDSNSSTYDIIFPLSSDRNIYDNRVILNYTNDKQKHSKEILVKQDVILELYLKPNLERELTLVSKYQANVEFFKDESVLLYLQSNTLYTGMFELLELPLISYDFYKIAHNQKTINTELNNISEFLSSSIYKPISDYEVDTKSLDDLMPTTYRIRIKFIKTFGLSKLLSVGNISVTELQNLQISPKFYISKLNPDYDMSVISSILNDEFTSWDFNSQDLHMSILTAGILTNVEDDLSSLQFSNFAEYPADYHTMKSNGKREKYNDVPEVVSIKPRYNEELKIYEHDCSYIELL